MLVVLTVVGIVFLVDPIVQEYPGAARMFPMATAAVVTVGSVSLLGRNYLPAPLRVFVAESITITDTGDATQEPATEADEEPDTEPRMDDRPRTLGEKYGFTVNDTVFMVGTSILYVALGYAAGLLYVTPLFVFFYTAWFRVPWYLCIALAAATTLVVLGFAEFLFLPFDRGEIVLTEAEVRL
jgi:hypothetical protein